MIDTPCITQVPTQLIASIRLTVPREEIRQVMGPGLEDLRAAVAAQEIAEAGPWFTHHLRMDPDVFDIEIGLPVAAPVVATGRVQPGERPAMKVAQAVYGGPYEGLCDAWSEFLDWIAACGHQPAPDLYECYAVGPETSPDPSVWRTEFIKPLVS